MFAWRSPLLSRRTAISDLTWCTKPGVLGLSSERLVARAIGADGDAMIGLVLVRQRDTTSITVAVHPQQQRGQFGAFVISGDQHADQVFEQRYELAEGVFGRCHDVA